MREIKFHAWNAKWEMMLDVLSIDFAGGLVFVQPLGDNSGIEEIDLEDVKLLQYTGMNDCDGVEIYVNDIVIITYSEDGETNEEIRVVSDAGKGQGYSPLNWGEICKSCDHCVEINSIKVIGNIYENLELMEVE